MYRENDDDYRNRLIDAPQVSYYFAEDIGNASGVELDLIGEILGLKRITFENK